MITLCDFLMRHGEEAVSLICNAVRGNSIFPGKIIVSVVMMVLAGAMTSAAGEMVRLMLPFRYAYPAGLLGSLCIAWLMSQGEMKPFSVISLILTGLFFGLILLLLRENGGESAVLIVPPSGWDLLVAAVRAIGYGAMNITVSMGFMCRSGCRSRMYTDRRAVCFGLGMSVLLFLSNALYLHHPGTINSAFPIVELLSAYGRAGYLICAALLYTAILTTLIAMVSTLCRSFEGNGVSKSVSSLIPLAVILAISQFGFSGIVNGFYAPLGLLCLLAVFLPLCKKFKRKSY